MSALFEELDYRATPIGALSLRRRRELRLGVDVFEIKLGEDYLMSSLFTASEIALARLGLDELAGRNLDVVVGGLGLGHTARAVLEHAQVGSLVVVEALAAVIDWHRNGLVPLGAELTGDARCRFVHGDFFALAQSGAGFDPDAPGRCFDAVLVDIDHAPDLLLHPRNAAFYQAEGLQPAGREVAGRRRARSVVQRASRRGVHGAAHRLLCAGARRTGDLSQPAAGPALHPDSLPGANRDGACDRADRMTKAANRGTEIIRSAPSASRSSDHAHGTQ